MNYSYLKKDLVLSATSNDTSDYSLQKETVNTPPLGLLLLKLLVPILQETGGDSWYSKDVKEPKKLVTVFSSHVGLIKSQKIV